jgi:pre-mRNA-processing factor 19
LFLQWFFIKVSNEVPDQPVLSPVSGCIYEKRLIIKYLQESSTDPITGQSLTEDQLVEVKGTLIISDINLDLLPFCQ